MSPSRHGRIGVRRGGRRSCHVLSRSGEPRIRDHSAWFASRSSKSVALGTHAVSPVIRHGQARRPVKAVTAIARINAPRRYIVSRCVAWTLCPRVWLVARRLHRQLTPTVGKLSGVRCSRCLRIGFLKSGLVLLCKWRDFRRTVEAPRFAHRKSVICDALRAKLARGHAKWCPWRLKAIIAGTAFPILWPAPRSIPTTVKSRVHSMSTDYSS